MKKLKGNKEILKIVIVLTAIAAISGLLLGIMNKVTSVDPAEVLLKDIRSMYDAEVEKLNVDNYKNIDDTEILNAFLASDNTYIIESKSNKAYSGKGLKLIVVVKNGKVIKLNGKGNSETPGLGTKALADSYLNQYIGVGYDYFAESDSVEDFREKGIKLDWHFVVDEPTSDNTSVAPLEGVSAISGATKSSDGVKNAVKAALAFYEYMEGKNE